jgi:nicotinate-nucleotide adenylyltransferase
MLELAISGNPAFEVCQWELERGGVSYTVETLTHLSQELPDAELFFLMGADSLRDFPAWRNPAKICQLATPLVVARPDTPAPDLSGLATWLSAEARDRITDLVVKMPMIQLSSSDIRQRCADGQSIRYRTPRAVEAYIDSHRLYRATSE